MACPICEKNLEIYEKKVNADDNQTIVNKYAVCRDCKKQWPLKKKVLEPVSDEKTTSTSFDSDDSFDAYDDSDTLTDASAPRNRQKSHSSTPQSRPRKRTEPKPDDLPKRKSGRGESKSPYAKKNPSKKHQKQTGKKATGKVKRPVFKIPRIALGLLSLIAFGYLAYQSVQAYFSTITILLPASQAIAYVVVAACALVSGIILIATAKGNSIGAYVLPAILYLAGGVYALIFRGNSFVLLTCSIVAVLLSLFLALLSVQAKRRIRSSRR